jgi:ribosomal protein S18 acetylase RimI-like enzyme
MSVTLRPTTLADRDAIARLHRAVAAIGGGLAREPDEITDALVTSFLTRSIDTGVALVAVERDAQGVEQIIGEIHAAQLTPRCFGHILGELTIAVDAAHQRKGVGRALFTELLRHVKEERPAFLRVELWVRGSNARAIALYESLGFRKEGALERRVRINEQFEVDIPMAWERLPPT